MPGLSTPWKISNSSSTAISGHVSEISLLRPCALAVSTRHAPAVIALIPGALFLALGTACHRETMPDPVVVRVVRDPSFAADLIVPNAKFVKSEPHLRSGRRVTLDIRDDVSYWDYSQRIRAFAPSVLIFLSRESIPTASGVASQLGFPEFVCGIHPAFVPASVTGEEREAAAKWLGVPVESLILQD